MTREEVARALRLDVMGQFNVWLNCSSKFDLHQVAAQVLYLMVNISFQNYSLTIGGRLSYNFN